MFGDTKSTGSFCCCANAAQATVPARNEQNKFRIRIIVNLSRQPSYRITPNQRPVSFANLCHVHRSLIAMSRSWVKANSFSSSGSRLQAPFVFLSESSFSFSSPLPFSLQLHR
jgi:hypothetical protein